MPSNATLLSLQKRLRLEGYYYGELDGFWGKLSQAAFDRALGDAVAYKNDQDFGSRKLTPDQVAQLAASEGLLPAHIYALIEVESNGGWFEDIRKEILELDGPGGFLDGNYLPKILFEAHIFSRLSNHQYDSINPQISSPTWNRALYKGGQQEYARLHQAMELDMDVALQSASWGLFQIMGFNYAACGYKDVFAFVDDMKKTELYHLHALLKFLKHNGLTNLLKDKKWARFARAYNGPGYRVNKYDEKLEAAFLRHNK